MSEMPVVTAPFIADAHQLWEEAETAYATGSTEFAYWSLIDLRSSASYRELFGNELAFCRAETFFKMFGMLAEHFKDEVVALKEMGDGLLFKSSAVRPIIEIVCMLDAVRRSWPASDSRRSAPNFDFSASVNSGECIRLPREAIIDYLGRPIDRLARLSGFRDPSDSGLLMVVEGDTANRVQQDVEREYDFLSFSVPELLPRALQKSGEEPIRFSRIRIDRAKFDACRRRFAVFRKPI